MPCPKLAYFYDAAGQIDTDKIDNLLGNQKTNQVKIVAWYKYKHSNAFKMTIREKIVHKRLCQHYAVSNPELFACCLLTTNSSQNGSTHLYSQTFLRYIEPTYQMIPMHIVNLSDPNDSYRSAEPQSRHFIDLTKSLGVDKKRTRGINVVMQMNEELQNCTEKVAEELAEAEKKYYDLQEEVKALQEKLKQKQMLKNANTLVEDKTTSQNTIENGNSEDLLDGENVKDDSEEVTKGKRGLRKTPTARRGRNSSRSPVNHDINLDNVLNSRTRGRTPTGKQKK